MLLIGTHRELKKQRELAAATKEEEKKKREDAKAAAAARIQAKLDAKKGGKGKGKGKQGLEHMISMNLNNGIDGINELVYSLVRQYGGVYAITQYECSMILNVMITRFKQISDPDCFGCLFKSSEAFLLNLSV